MEDLTGKQLGSYQVVAPLGEGGMAAVYKAYQPAMDRYVALKILPRHFASDPQFIDRFQQEARLLAKLQHPHILPVFDFGETDGYTYIVMPFIEGGTLVNLMHDQPLALEQIQTVITQVGDALDYAHVHGLIHRDVKPSNVLIDERGNCLLMDFGLAKIVESSAHLTTSGAIVGTPAYMSPEQGLGQKLDARTDIYSLGVILYEMATGRVPYRAETPMAVVIKHIHDPLPPPHMLNSDLPEAVERVIFKALAKDPCDRFATASEMVKTLRMAIAEMTPVPIPQVVSAPESEKSIERPAPARVPPIVIPLWRLILQCIAGWAVGIVIGMIFASLQPFVGFLMAGAVGGLGLGMTWRRIEPSVSRKPMFSLMVIWALALGVIMIPGPLIFISGGLAGWLSALVFGRVQPALTRKRIIFIALGWELGWAVGGILFSIATTQLVQLASASLAVLAITLAVVIGSGVMFTQYRQVCQTKV